MGAPTFRGRKSSAGSGRVWDDVIMCGEGRARPPHSSPVDHLADELRPVGPHPHTLDQTDCNGTLLHLQWYQQEETVGTRGTHTTWMDCGTGALIVRRLTAVAGLRLFQSWIWGP